MSHVYRIISVDDSYQKTGKIYIKIQVVGKSTSFDRPVSELYQEEWLNQFSREDVAHIAALYTAEHTNNLNLIKMFPKKITTIPSSVIVISILYTAFLILSNLTAFKLISFGHIVVTAGIIFFPLTYIFDDILTEVYGFKISRRIIWMALIANMIIFIGTLCTIYLPAAIEWHEQTAYATVYHATFRILIASTISYLIGEFINSITLAKLKIIMHGKHFWLRAIASTIIGVGLDTVLFTHIAFLFIIPYFIIWKIIGSMFFLKVTYEILALPLTYKISNYLKRKDNTDFYDFQTKFNPFSLAI